MERIRTFAFILLGGIALGGIYYLGFNQSKTVKKDNFIEKLYPSEEYFMMKQYPATTFAFRAFDKALANVQKFIQSPSNRSVGQWEVQGPGNIGARANTIAIDPKNSNNMLIGYSEGGIFRTQDGGQNWFPVFDDQFRLSIGDIVFDPQNSSVVYAGTGDPNISGFPFIGDGMYKSSDGGNSWQNIGLRETRVISQIRVSAQNNQVIYVSAMGIPFEKSNHKGVYKSVNGGQTWEQVLFINDSTGIADLVIHPSNHNIVYAAGWNRIRNNYRSVVDGPDAKIYKSENGGITWTVLGNGLPMDASSRIGIDISKSNPNILYACYAEAGNFKLKGIYKSTNGGDSWTSLDVTEFKDEIYGGFGWYFGKIRINPNDANDVFLLGVDMIRSKDGGASWTSAVPPWPTYEVHADKHDLIFDGDKMYLTTDGGAYSSDINTDTWQKIENNPTTQFYRVAFNPHQPDIYYGGAQDNGTSKGNASNINSWDRVFGGDGFQAIFHPIDSNIVYVETQNGDLWVSNDSGEHFSSATLGLNDSEPRNWDMPIIMSRHNPDVLYTGTDRIYKNTSGSQPYWEVISPVLTDPSSAFLRHNISTIHSSPLDENLIAAGTSDGLLWATDDGGATWHNISAGLPYKYVSSVYFSEKYPKTLFVSFTGYKDNDNTPYIYKSNDLGATWTPVQGNLPLIAINNILALDQTNKSKDILFVATDGGVFFTKDHVEWDRVGDNMPLVTVYDIDYNPNKNELVAGTFGRSIQSFDLKQINYPDAVANENLSSDKFFDIQNSIISDNAPLIITKRKFTSVQLQMADISGKLIKNIDVNNEKTEVDMCGFAPGCYFLSVKDKKAKAIRIVKI